MGKWRSCLPLSRRFSLVIRTKEIHMKSIEEALATFEKCATIQAQTFETGDYRKGNKYFDKLMKSIVFLYEQKHLIDLEPFLHHQNVGVRSTAAFALLPVIEEKSKTVLQEIADNDYGIHSLNAERTLLRWNNNEIIFPYQAGWIW